MAVVEERGIDPEKIQGGINIDPLTNLTLKGKICCENPFGAPLENTKKMAAYKNFKTIEVGGYVFNNSGASIVQELGFSLAAGVEYLDKLTEAGMSVNEIAPRIRFHFATSSKYFTQRVPSGLFIRLLAVQKTRVPVAHVLRLPVRGARHQPGAHAAVAEYHVRQRFRDFRHAAYQKCR